MVKEHRVCMSWQCITQQTMVSLVRGRCRCHKRGELRSPRCLVWHTAASRRPAGAAQTHCWDSTAPPHRRPHALPAPRARPPVSDARRVSVEHEARGSTDARRCGQHLHIRYAEQPQCASGDATSNHYKRACSAVLELCMQQRLKRMWSPGGILLRITQL